MMNVEKRNSNVIFIEIQVPFKRHSGKGEDNINNCSKINADAVTTEETGTKC